MSPQPTDQQLRAAWERERGPTWPATFDAAMADAVYSRLIRGAAKRALHRSERAAANAGPAGTYASAPSRCPFCGCRTTGAAHPRPLDARQLAAGERADA